MARRVMFVQLKSGHDTDRGPSWIGWVAFTRSWATARFHGREISRVAGLPGSNFVDVDPGERYRVSGPKRDRTDTRNGPGATVIDDDVRRQYESLLAGASLPGRDRG